MGKLVFAFQLVAIAIGSAGVAQKQTPPSPTHSQKACSRDEERQALDEYKKLKTWADIFRSLRDLVIAMTEPLPKDIPTR